MSMNNTLTVQEANDRFEAAQRRHFNMMTKAINGRAHHWQVTEARFEMHAALDVWNAAKKTA